MSPEKARIFVAEDDSDWQEIISSKLRRAGHQVVARASSLPEALSAVKTLLNLNVDVAVLDGNLNEHDHDGRDGQSVLRAIREHAPHIRVVGMSGASFRGADVDLGKDNVDEIGDVVNKL